MPYTLTVGAIRCHIVSDGLHHVDGGGFFGLVPRALWQRIVQPDQDNLIPADLRCMLIESDAGLILVDTGYGDKLDAKTRSRLGMSSRNRRLVGQMRDLGFAPEDVDIVLLTHFHGDHVGGATCREEPDDPRSPLVPTFPRARVIGQRIEFADACYPNERTAATYIADNWIPLNDARRLELVDGPQRLARGVRTVITPGHTAALQAVWIEDDGDSLLFVGDAANWAVHLERLAWVPSYDVYPLTSMETKRGLRFEAHERQSLIVFQHDASVVTGRVVRSDSGWKIDAQITKPPELDESAPTA